MKYCLKFGAVVVAAMFSMNAFAGSVSSFHSSGVSGLQDTSVRGNFTPDAPLSFFGNSIFDGLSGTIAQPKFENNFLISTTLSGYGLSHDIPPNVLQLGSNAPVLPGLTGRQGDGQQVPEGGTRFSFLISSGLVLLAGIFLASKQRRNPAVN